MQQIDCVNPMISSILRLTRSIFIGRMNRVFSFEIFIQAKASNSSRLLNKTDSTASSDYGAYEFLLEYTLSILSSTVQTSVCITNYHWTLIMTATIVFVLAVEEMDLSRWKSVLFIRSTHFDFTP